MSTIVVTHYDTFENDFFNGNDYVEIVRISTFRVTYFSRSSEQRKFVRALKIIVSTVACIGAK